MNKKKILVVEDSKVIRRSLALLLEKNNFEVTQLSNAENIFTNPDLYRDCALILLDIGLPGVDGLTALEYLNQFSALNHIPVIIISGHSELAIVQKAVSLKVVDYVRKPYLASQLLERVNKILSLQSPDSKNL